MSYGPMEIEVLVERTIIPNRWRSVFASPRVEKMWVDFVAVIKSWSIRGARQGGTRCHFLEFLVADPC